MSPPPFLPAPVVVNRPECSIILKLRRRPLHKCKRRRISPDDRPIAEERERVFALARRGSSHFVNRAVALAMRLSESECAALWRDIRQLAPANQQPKDNNAP